MAAVVRIKVSLDKDIRRLSAPRDMPLIELLQTLQARFSLNREHAHLSVKWIDEDGDFITILDDADLAEAFSFDNVRLILTTAEAHVSTSPASGTRGPARVSSTYDVKQNLSAMAEGKGVEATEKAFENPSGDLCKAVPIGKSSTAIETLQKAAAKPSTTVTTAAAYAASSSEVLLESSIERPPAASSALAAAGGRRRRRRRRGSKLGSAALSESQVEDPHKQQVECSGSNVDANESDEGTTSDERTNHKCNGLITIPPATAKGNARLKAAGKDVADNSAGKKELPIPAGKNLLVQEMVYFNRIYSLCKHNKYREIENLLEKGAPVNATDEFGNTGLMIAAQNDYKRMTKLLLRHNADINAQNNKGSTALHFAYTHGFKVLAEYLKDKGAVRGPC